MKRTAILLIFSAILNILSSCHKYEEFDNDAEGTFEALWNILDRRYCFFQEKELDWNEIHDRYKARLVKGITSDELFSLCSEMISELRDGHTNLISGFDIYYYSEWWNKYPKDFDWRTVEEYYLGFDYNVASGLIYKILPQNMGYIRYSSFSNVIGEGNLDYVLSYLAPCDGLIIDIRDNGGGELTNISKFISRFIHTPVTGGYISHKTGPGHNEFSQPYPFYYKPAAANRQVWNKPIVVLINRKCYSAANDFAAVMKRIPGVELIGSRTGGGGGLPFSADLPNGWKVRFSASVVYDADGQSIESGIDPTDGCEVHCSDEALANGSDEILDFAIKRLSNKRANY